MDDAPLARPRCRRCAAKRHYGDRVVRCFVERPRSAYDLLADARGAQPGRRGARLRRRAAELPRRSTHAVGAMRRRARGARHRRRRPGRAAARQRHRVPGRAVRRAAPRRDRGAARASASRRRASPTCSPTAGAKLLVHDAELADRLPEPAADAGAGASRRGRAGRALHRDAAARAADRRRAGRRAGGGHRDHPLHLGHHRPAEGRDAHPSRHLPLGACTTSAAWASTPATARRWRCR